MPKYRVTIMDRTATKLLQTCDLSAASPAEAVTQAFPEYGDATTAESIETSSDGSTIFRARDSRIVARVEVLAAGDAPVRKRVTVEIEFEVTKLCEDTTLERLDVYKVTVDGKEVCQIDDQPTLSTNEEHYWPIVELEEDYLDLHLIRV